MRRMPARLSWRIAWRADEASDEARHIGSDRRAHQLVMMPMKGSGASVTSVSCHEWWSMKPMTIRNCSTEAMA